MKQTKFIRLVIAAVFSAASSTCAIAQMKNEDILGIKLGMTAEQVRAVVKSQNPAMRTRDAAKYQDQPGLPSSVAVIQFCEGPPSPDFTSCSDEIAVTIGQATHKVWHIHRSVWLTRPKLKGVPPENILVKSIVDSIIDKYGAPTNSRPIREDLFNWSYDNSNKPTSGCVLNAYGNVPEWGETRRGERQRGNPACGMSMAAIISKKGGTSSAFAEYMGISAFDARLLNEDLDKANAIVRAYQQEKDRDEKAFQQGKEREAAGAKPKL